MSPEADGKDKIDHARISDVTGTAERTVLQGLVKSQPFWVTIALILLAIAIGLYQPSFVSVTEHRQRHPQLRARSGSWRWA